MHSRKNYTLLRSGTVPPKNNKAVGPVGKGPVLRPRKEKQEVVSPEAWVNRAELIVHMTMQVLVSLVILSAALWVILSGQVNDAMQKWAFGAVGTVLGYWLRVRK